MSQWRAASLPRREQFVQVWVLAPLISFRRSATIKSGVFVVVIGIWFVVEQRSRGKHARCLVPRSFLMLVQVLGFAPGSFSHQAPEIRSPARHVEGILACRGLVASLLCLALSDGCQEEAATEAKDRLPGSIARLMEPSAEEVHAASPPMAELVASVREEVRSLLHQAHRDANRIQQRLRHLAAFAQLCRNLASSRPSCCRISGLRDSSLPRQLPIYASVRRSCDRRS